MWNNCSLMTSSSSINSEMLSSRFPSLSIPAQVRSLAEKFGALATDSLKKCAVVSIQTSPMDLACNETGKAVHEQCYVERLQGQRYCIATPAFKKYVARSD
jgi:hypothetical protein